jgi:hypothetical protein
MWGDAPKTRKIRRAVEFAEDAIALLAEHRRRQPAQRPALVRSRVLGGR